jgi:hypothetical protein
MQYMQKSLKRISITRNIQGIIIEKTPLIFLEPLGPLEPPPTLEQAAELTTIQVCVRIGMIQATVVLEVKNPFV